MILFNLLPHREAAKKKIQQAFYGALVLSVVAGLLVAAIVDLVQTSQMETQVEKNNLLKTEIASLEKQIVEVRNLESEIAILGSRKSAVESLQADRNVPVHLVEALARLTPDGVHLTGIKQDGITVTLNGVAQSNQRISELLRNLETKSEWLQTPELVEIIASTTAVSVRDQRPTANFTMKVKLKPLMQAASSASASK
jgi:type IV pilus assembly protein PilN